MDKSIKENVLLSDEAVFAALQWGIQDRSTTIRETKYLVEALELLSKDILEVYFNIKQLSIQEVERRKLETNCLLGRTAAIYKVKASSIFSS